MPFGLSNGPTTFQSLMNKVFFTLRKFVLVLFDNILIYSIDIQTHVKHLAKVFEFLRQQQLHAKLNKCVFAQGKMEYLGHITSDKGVEVDPGKIKDM